MSSSRRTSASSSSRSRSSRARLDWLTPLSEAEIDAYLDRAVIDVNSDVHMFARIVRQMLDELASLKQTIRMMELEAGDD